MSAAATLTWTKELRSPQATRRHGACWRARGARVEGLVHRLSAGWVASGSYTTADGEGVHLIVVAAQKSPSTARKAFDQEVAFLDASAQKEPTP